MAPTMANGHKDHPKTTMMMTKEVVRVRMSSSRAIGASRALSNVPDEEAQVLREIQATHAHDACFVEVAPVLNVVEDILKRSNLSSDASTVLEAEMASDALQEKLGSLAAAGSKGTMLEALAVVIQKVCCEFSCKCSGTDLHASTIDVLKMLGNYSWDAKVVITLAAFAVTYGELWLVILLGLANHPLAKSIAVLKQTPELSEITGVLEPQLATLNDLLEVVRDMANSLIEFSSLPCNYITPEDPPLASSMTLIAKATYWSIRSIIACGARISSNIGITSGIASSFAETWDLSSLMHKDKSLQYLLRQKLVICYEHIELIKAQEAYTNLVCIYQTHQTDNFKFLKELINPRGDKEPLVKISPKKPNLYKGTFETLEETLRLPKSDDVLEKRFQVDVLKGKTVLFLISDLDVSEEELAILAKTYKESRQNEERFQYEIVWLPVIDIKTKEHDQKFKELQYKMPWFTLARHSLLNAVSIRFVREYFKFVKKQRIVAVDPLGFEASLDAFHLILIWGNLAYPFTKVKEHELWKKETWTPDLLLASVFPEYNNWVGQPNTYVCFFGGEDIEWIRKFTTSTRELTSKLGIKVELVYIGKPNSKEAVRRIIKIITSEKIAYTLPNVTSVTYFWTRLESMLFTRTQYVMDVDNDNIIKKVISTLCFGSSHEGFGSVAKPGTTDMIEAKGDHIMVAFSNQEFGEKYKQKGVIFSLLKIIEILPGNEFHCNRVEFPSIDGASVPSKVICTDCQRPMEKYLLYKCCTG